MWTERVRRAAAYAVTKWARPIGVGLGLAACVVLPARQGAFGGVQRSLRFGGPFQALDIHSVTTEGVVPCEVADLVGHEMHCPGIRIQMITSHDVYDAPVGWPAPLPGIAIGAGAPWELNIRAPGTWGAGEHRLFCQGACSSAAVVVGGEEHTLAAGMTRVFELPAAQDGLELHVRGNGGDTALTLVRSDAIDIDRHADVPFCEE
jgi:hypothetical protein